VSVSVFGVGVDVLDDVQAASSGQLGYQGVGDRAGAGSGGSQIAVRFDQEHPALGMALPQDSVVKGGPVVHGFDTRNRCPALDPSLRAGFPLRK
jgi:hypothetical protein